MRLLSDCALIAAPELPGRAALLRADGWRLVTASSIRRSDGAFTVLYHFERGERLVHLRIELPAVGVLPSIGSVYPAAFLVENEMVELQGVPIGGMTIDYGGRLYRDFDRLEGWVHEDAGVEQPPSRLQIAATLRLDACVPVGISGREVRAPQSRIPTLDPNGHDGHAGPPPAGPRTDEGGA